jgi:glucokinase
MHYYLGIDLGGTNTKAGIVDDQGKIYCKDSIKTFADRDQYEIVHDMGTLAKRVIDACGIPFNEITAIGVGAPGTSDNVTGELIFTGNLSFRHMPIRDEFHKMIDLPFYIGNDANVAALAESKAGAAQGSQSSVTITLGTGVGGGFVINNRIYSGFNQAGCEIGHTVVVAGGEPCTCGRRGCFEVYSSATALVRDTTRAAKAHPESILNQLILDNLGHVDGRTAFIAMRAGDPTASAVIEHYIEMLAESLANVINSCMPEVIAIGGGISHEGDALLLPVRDRALARAFLAENIAKPRIVLAKMGNDAGIVGAAMMAMNCMEDGLIG